MQKEIEEELLRVRIIKKERLKRFGLYSLITSAIIVFFYVIPYFYLNPSLILGIGTLLLFPSGIILAVCLTLLYSPLPARFRAFQEIAKAIEVLEKSSESIAYEEAYRHLKKALHELRTISLETRGWYSENNKVIKHFRENLELIVLSELSTSNMKKEHLEEIALAVISGNTLKMQLVNKTLESEESYKKSEPSPSWLEKFETRLRETKILKLLYSLVLGYGLVLAICAIYVALTEQNFMIFAREKPEIVILGGLTVSGLTFWKAK